MESFSVFLKRFFAFLSGPVLATGISFILVPVTTWLVVPSEFGKASLYTLAISFFSLFVYLGIDQAYVREYHESDDKQALLSNALFFPLFFALVISIVVSFFWRIFSYILFGEETFLPVILFAIALPFTVLERFNLLTIRMQEKAVIYSLFTIFRQLIRCPLLLLFLFYFRSFHGIIIAEASSQVILSIISGVVVKKNWLIFFSFKTFLIKKFLRFGLPLLPATLLMWFFNGTSTMALRYWGSFEDVGLYASAFKIVAVMNIFNSAFSTFWIPTAYRWKNEGVDIKKYEIVGDSISFQHDDDGVCCDCFSRVHCKVVFFRLHCHIFHYAISCFCSYFAFFF
ncbi:lipopolysaccharide biosynthesis protein [Aminivibrio sp.]|uniref:lipopolysaccharide biosynthesis protein n=1 Tax=Aminivibrio sp. TaxID=1872489 RepID=UPI003D969552